MVASMPDPNPLVSGQGFGRLRAAGVQVEVGGREGQARRLNETFARYIRHGTPLVTLKAAMTLDGKICIGSHNGITTFGFADGHVKALKREKLMTLAGTSSTWNGQRVNLVHYDAQFK